MPKNMVFNVPDRSMSKRRLEFQHHLIKQYVRSASPAKDPKDLALQAKQGFFLSSDLRKDKSEEQKLSAFNSNSTEGYNCGDYNLTERFNSNNIELN